MGYVRAHPVRQPPPLREQSEEELINGISMSVRFAMQNLDECAGAMLKIMELQKKYGDEIPDFGSVPGAWRNLATAREAIDMLRFRIKNRKEK